MSLFKKVALLTLPLVMSGCVAVGENLSPELAFTRVASGGRDVIGKDTAWVQNSVEAAAVNARVSSLLSAGRYVGAEAAVQVALLNNKGLQAAYADIGLSAADLWQESLLVNPAVSLGYSGIGVGRTIEGAIATNIVALVTRERRLDLAEARLLQTQLRAVEQTFALATATRRAWIEAVAAWERVSYLNRARAAADAASELAAELGRTGSYTRSQQAREQAFYAELTGETAEARLEARLAKEELVRLMGLWGSNLDFEVPNALPNLPTSLQQRDAIEAEALRNRVDLQGAKLALDALARSYGLTSATRFASDVELAVGFEVEQETEEEEDGSETKSNTLSGSFEVGFAIPIFDSGQARLRAAEYSYLKAANLLAERAVNVRSEARSAYQAYRSRYDIARHYRGSVVPLRTTVEEESVLTYNGMITSTFELLIDTREKTEALISSVNAKRAFWLADAGLTAAIYGGGEPPEAVEMAEAGGGED